MLSNEKQLKFFFFNLATPLKGHRRSMSSNNLLAPSPAKTPAPHDPTQDDSDTTNGTINGSPTIHHDVPIGRSSSDGKDYVTSSLRNQDAYPVKKKYKNRNKSCELELNQQEMIMDPCSDVDGIFFVPTTPVTKKKTHRRQKSNAASKDFGLESRATDNGILILFVFIVFRRLLPLSVYVKFQ